MEDIVIRAEHVGKKYPLGGTQESYKTLREALTVAALKPAKSLLNLTRRKKSGSTRNQSIWALKDVSFEVSRGEVLGIIGRNGAGKSTLLKILSRIVDPSEGFIDICGRVGSLLEVGTGFHPELTGRENIFLNGAILGMGKSEIKQKFDEIVAFAEVERFIDTPVKRYSSGMYLRLAFAVAAHLEPEILVVDEVLAVGDAGFQQRCLGKMGEVARGGRTVLFVSHNMAAVEALCTRCIGMLDGGIVQEGLPGEVIPKYMKDVIANRIGGLSVVERTDRVGSGEARFSNIRLLNDKSQEIGSVPMGESIILEADYEVTESIREPIFGFLIANKMGSTILRAYSHESNRDPMPTISNNGTIRCRFDTLPLMHGEYSVHLWLSRHNQAVDYIEHSIDLKVLKADVYNTGRAPDAFNGGVCYAKHNWSFKD